MKSINWTLTDVSEDERPQLDPERDRTQERPTVTQETLERDELRQSAEHRVLRNIARTYHRYYGPKPS